MTDYPILVERYQGKQSMVIVCESCGAEEQINPNDFGCEGLYSCPAECHPRATAVFKYEEADRCLNCRKLGHFPEWCAPCCSRVCKSQTEWAQELAARRKVAA